MPTTVFLLCFLCLVFVLFVVAAGGTSLCMDLSVAFLLVEVLYSKIGRFLNISNCMSLFILAENITDEVCKRN